MNMQYLPAGCRPIGGTLTGPRRFRTDDKIMNVGWQCPTDMRNAWMPLTDTEVYADRWL